MLKVVGASWNKIRASTWIIGAVLVLGIVVLILGELGQLTEDGNWAATVYWSEESGFEIIFWGQGRKVEDIPKGVARAYYQCHVNTTGWAILDVETQPDYPDWVQAFGAGMLEGSLSWQMIHWHRQNTLRRDCEHDPDLCEKIDDYLQENLEWVKQEYSKRTSSYWHQIHLFYLQLEGVQKGFEQGVKRSRVNNVDELTFEDLLWLNAVNDMNGIRHKFSYPKRQKTLEPLAKFRRKRFISYSFGDQNLSQPLEKSEHHIYRCGYDQLPLSSAFIKLVSDEGKLFVAHNSGGPYSSMLKMLKHYQFSYQTSKNSGEIVAGQRITFSSYPGVVHSTDDFFIVQNDETEQELVVAGVPLPVYNDQLWQLLSPTGQVLIGPRVMVANRLATNGKEWGEILSKYNSGTGNKEWMILDFKKFERIVERKKDNEQQYRTDLDSAEEILYVAEQVPGTFEIADKTDILKLETYWASYGLPFFKKISNITGTDSMVEQFGKVYSYEETPLARIFRRDHNKTRDLKSVAMLMRSNLYKTDPLSYNNPRCAIGGRGDLSTEYQEARPEGVTGTSVYSSSFLQSSSEMVQAGFTRSERQFQIKAGPPYSDSWNVLNRTEDLGDSLGPFDWRKPKFHQVPHTGHPDIWNFEPVIIF